MMLIINSIDVGHHLKNSGFFATEIGGQSASVHRCNRWRRIAIHARRSAARSDRGTSICITDTAIGCLLDGRRQEGITPAMAWSKCSEKR